MTIKPAQAGDKKIWNDFVHEHYPSVGVFMQTWEWGLFQEQLGRRVGRYFLNDNGKTIAAFTLIHHALPMGLTYGYAARGPVISISHQNKAAEIFQAIREWSLKEFPRFVFLRLEPPISTIASLPSRNFKIPKYYIQPRFNEVVAIKGTEEEILASFHPSTRSNIRRAEKRGVMVKTRSDITAREYKEFVDMMGDTIKRNSGVNAYPGRAYFDALFATLSHDNTTASDQRGLSLLAFYGYQHDEPAATHFVLFFGSTATYLYGASYTKHLNSKAPTYLHWAAIQEAKRRGMRYYDLGGIDAERWPKLTDFKRQFRGEEVGYIGNIDIPFSQMLYKLYSWTRGFKHKQ